MSVRLSGLSRRIEGRVRDRVEARLARRAAERAWRRRVKASTTFQDVQSVADIPASDATEGS
ncbi:MAG: hypothetical protein JNM89_03390 [Hyphomicrobiaceae bacterium]|nr:hypothetical protein [Hyphomicrobiaceae bacterium]